MNESPILITSALPYANGPLHIGHIAGVYLPSDIYTRYCRSSKRDVISICGSDEHGVAISLKARAEDTSPKAIIDKYNAIIKQSLLDFGIYFDIYSRTSTETHKETAQEFFLSMHKAGKFIEKTSMQYYDEKESMFLADRYIVGECPSCHSDGAYGDQCEKCGTSLDPTELINPKSKISGASPILKETKHWYLPLNDYEEWLREWIESKNKSWRPSVLGQCKSWLDAGLAPRTVTRDIDWGIPVPLDNAKGKVLYVWFEAPIGYISATKDLTANWRHYWCNPNAKVYNFIGKDNIVFHSIIFPAILKNLEGFVMPEEVVANEFLNLEGDKISTSRGWAVWLHEYIEEFPDRQDLLRYVLCSIAPESKDNDFSWKDFQTRVNSELVAILGNFVNRVLILTEKYYDSVVPSNTQPYNSEDLVVIEQLKKTGVKVGESLDKFRFREALKEAMNIARIGNKYLTDNEPWKQQKSDPERVKTVMKLALEIVANLSIVLEPFLPFTAKKISEMLNITEILEWRDLGRLDLISGVSKGDKIGEIALLFENVTDEEVEFQVAKLETKKSTKTESAVGVNVANSIKEELEALSPVLEECSFEDFAKIDLRCGTILKAERVPKTDKLMLFSVDIGIEVRTIVSGIAHVFKPEELLGKRVVVLANLKPKEIKKITSHGMLLLSGSGDNLKFIEPAKDSRNGDEIS